MLTRLEAQNIRNLRCFALQPATTFNALQGPNGSGKTSLLEAIYLLGTGRSFRSHLMGRIINQQASQLAVFGATCTENNPTTTIGLEKHRNGTTRIQINNQPVPSVADLAKTLPLLLINQQTFSLLEGGAKPRRQFLDWGTFHVEPRFYQTWQQAQKSIAQRNAALRQQQSRHQLKLWDDELSKIANTLNAQRQQYISEFLPIFHQFAQDLAVFPELELQYYPGWPETEPFADALSRAYLRDQSLGYTQFGPHRADLTIKVGGLPAQDVLSRGEQKTLIYALRLAQGSILKAKLGKICSYLIDDLPAELDTGRQEQVIRILAKLDVQIFITGTSLSTLQPYLNKAETKWFHVEQGEIKEGF